jgi:hypothetical protein
MVFMKIGVVEAILDGVSKISPVVSTYFIRFA